MSDNRELFIEEKIIGAIKNLFSVQVNEILNNWNFVIPLFEFSDYGGLSSITPVISLSSCEQTEKERIIKIDAYSMTIMVSIAENPENELFCYGYSNAFDKALSLDKTLNGIVTCATITGKKYIPPKVPNCGMEWELVISLRITVEGMNQ